MTVSFNPSPPLSVSPYKLLGRLVLKQDDPLAQYAPELLPAEPATRALGGPSCVFIRLDDPKAVWDALITDPTVSDLLDVHGRAYFVISVRTTNARGEAVGTGKITELEYVEVTKTNEGGVKFDYEAPAPVGCTCGRDRTRGAPDVLKKAASDAAPYVAGCAAHAGGVAMLGWAGFTKAGVRGDSLAAAWQSSLGSVSKNSWFSRFQSMGARGSIPWIRPLAVVLAAGAVIYAMSGKDEKELCAYCRLQKKGE